MCGLGEEVSGGRMDAGSVAAGWDGWGAGWDGGGGGGGISGVTRNSC